jgi:hypothetical protein
MGESLMPVQACNKDGKPGYKYGEQGVCYTYMAGNKASRNAAYAKAVRQGQAIKAGGK